MGLPVRIFFITGKKVGEINFGKDIWIFDQWVFEKFTTLQSKHASIIEDFRVEMMHGGSIYENQIETFSEVQKQRIDSRNMAFSKSSHGSNTLNRGTLRNGIKSGASSLHDAL
jgi:hypothetical protein